jgi:tRNA (cytidine/uridine-2'-O-)-methyltransferase
VLHVVLYQPEIAPNSGNVIRLCANTGAALHLVRPLGFELDDRRLRRAGLDYHEWARVLVHDDLAACIEQARPVRLLAFSTRAQHAYTECRFQMDDALLFGPETRGLPDELLQTVAPEHLLRIPMLPHSRSLNLSNAVAVVVYEAWRQLDFTGARLA